MKFVQFSPIVSRETTTCKNKVEVFRLEKFKSFDKQARESAIPSRVSLFLSSSSKLVLIHFLCNHIRELVSDFSLPATKWIIRFADSTKTNAYPRSTRQRSWISFWGMQESIVPLLYTRQAELFARFLWLFSSTSETHQKRTQENARRNYSIKNEIF